MAKRPSRKPRRPRRATPTVIAGETFYLLPVLTADRSRVVELPWKVVNAMGYFGCLLAKRKDRPMFHGQRYITMTRPFASMPKPVRRHPDLIRLSDAREREAGRCQPGHGRLKNS